MGAVVRAGSIELDAPKSNLPAFDIALDEGDNPKEVVRQIVAKKRPVSGKTVPAGSIKLDEPAPKSKGLLDRLMSFIAVDPDTFAESQGVMPEASKAVLEAAASLGTGATSWIPAGLSMFSTDLRSPTERAKTATDIQEALTYAPKSKAAQKLVEPVGQFFENYDIAGREYARNIENPLLATLVHTGTEAIPFLAPLAMKGVGAVKSGARDLAQLEGILERDTATVPRVPLPEAARGVSPINRGARESFVKQAMNAEDFLSLPEAAERAALPPGQGFTMPERRMTQAEQYFDALSEQLGGMSELSAKDKRIIAKTLERERAATLETLRQDAENEALGVSGEINTPTAFGGDAGAPLNATQEGALRSAIASLEFAELPLERTPRATSTTRTTTEKPAKTISAGSIELDAPVKATEAQKPPPAQEIQPLETTTTKTDVSNPPPASEIVQPGATSGVVAGKVAPTASDGSQPASIAKSIEAKAIEAGMVKDGFDSLAGFDPTTMKAQAERAADLLTTDFEKARRVVRGEDPVPDGLRGVSIVKAMEERIKATKDADLAYELANSPLASEVSLAGQELSLTRGRELDSFSAKVAEVKKAREAQAGADVSKKAEVKKQLKEETQKVNLPKEELSWDRFLQSIAC